MFTPLTEIPLVYDHINDSSYQPIAKKQVIRDDNGTLLLEHGYNQSQQVSDFLIKMAYKGIKTFSDLSGNDRITVAQLGTK